MNLSVEHVLLFLVGAFLVYHMIGKCGCNRVEYFSDESPSLPKIIVKEKLLLEEVDYYIKTNNATNLNKLLKTQHGKFLNFSDVFDYLDGGRGLFSTKENIKCFIIASYVNKTIGEDVRLVLQEYKKDNEREMTTFYNYGHC